jgi:trk system potassium uptake protein TrkA
LPSGAKSEWQDASGRVQLVELAIHPGWFGRQVLTIESLTDSRVAFVTRLGEGVIPDEKTVLQEGDLVHMLVTEKNLSQVEASLRNPPGGES